MQVQTNLRIYEKKNASELNKSRKPGERNFDVSQRTKKYKDNMLSWSNSN